MFSKAVGIVEPVPKPIFPAKEFAFVFCISPIDEIKDVFSSPNFVYKANVSIKLTDGTTQEKTIIGRTNNSLITIDDELIDVSKISQIDFLD